VHWTYVPFNRSFAPGKKPFDFDINQISYSKARAKVVTFSTSYYDVNQAIVVLKGTQIASVHTIAGLRPFKLGAQIGTTSYSFITSTIKPTTQPAVYPQNAGAVQALKNKQIAGLVVDLPTAFYVSAAQVPNSEVLGQFEKGGGNMGSSGAVAWMFDRRGIVTVDAEKIGEDDLMAKALDAGATDMRRAEKVYEITTGPAEMDTVRDALQKAGVPILEAQVTYVPQSTVRVEGPTATSVVRLVEALEDLDDVQHVYANFDIPDEVLEAISAA